LLHKIEQNSGTENTTDRSQLQPFSANVSHPDAAVGFPKADVADDGDRRLLAISRLSTSPGPLS
jgi:hypothetical protein